MSHLESCDELWSTTRRDSTSDEGHHSDEEGSPSEVGYESESGNATGQTNGGNNGQENKGESNASLNQGGELTPPLESVMLDSLADDGVVGHGPADTLVTLPPVGPQVPTSCTALIEINPPLPVPAIIASQPTGPEFLDSEPT
jgi:hypothetical protein